MPATDTAKDTAPDLSALLGKSIPGGVKLTDANEQLAREMKGTRGRREGEDIKALRKVLQECVKTNTAKVFEGIANTKDKDTLVRKIRQAAKGAGKNGADIEVSTSYNGQTNKLFWGPKEVVDKLKASAAA